MNNEDSSEAKQFVLAAVIILTTLTLATWKVIDWINQISWVDFSIYALIAIGSILTYATFKFLSKG